MMRHQLVVVEDKKVYLCTSFHNFLLPGCCEHWLYFYYLHCYQVYVFLQLQVYETFFYLHLKLKEVLSCV